MSQQHGCIQKQPIAFQRTSQQKTPEIALVAGLDVINPSKSQRAFTQSGTSQQFYSVDHACRRIVPWQGHVPFSDKHDLH